MISQYTAPVYQNDPVQPGGAVPIPRQRALQAASRQSAGFAVTHPVPLLSPPPPSQNTQNPPTLLSQDQPLPSLHDLPALEEIQRTRIPTATWVPKAAQAEFSQVFASQVNKVAFNVDSISAWTLQLMFARCILPAAKHRPDTTQGKAVKDRLARWRKGEYLSLWKEAVEMSKNKGKSRRRGRRQEEDPPRGAECQEGQKAD